jgi:predicted nicotinamide N-methyase
VRSLGPLEAERVPLPGVDVTLELRRPRPPASDDDQLPYWAEIWPSGVTLAGMIAREPDRLQGRPVLELGPGVGVTAIAALRAGADLVVADSSSAALALCALNAREQVGTEPRTVWSNWRYPTGAILPPAGAGFDVGLAADVLYENGDVRPLLRLVEQVVAPGGELWLAEPGRTPAERFVATLRRRGWAGVTEVCECAWPDPHEGVPGEVTVHRLRRPELSPTSRRSRTRP